MVLVLLTPQVIYSEIKQPTSNEVYYLNKQTREGSKMVARMQLSDQGMQAYKPPAPPIKAAPVKLHYDAPRVATQSGVTKQWSPGAGTNAAPIASPSYQAQYNPQPAYQAPAPVWQAPFDPGPAQQSFIGGGFNQAPAAPAPPPPPPPPVVGGREWFSKLGPTAKRAEENKWLGGDSDYASQIGEYDRALQSFIDRITKRKDLFDQDAIDSTAATNKNEGMTMNNLGEDFAARGLSYSGLFDQSKEEGKGRFRDARTGITKIRDANKGEADNQLGDYRSENQIGRGNARRAALQRMAADQALKDANNF
jgi:hypothetical protein